jgi:hypothetical protein
LGEGHDIAMNIDIKSDEPIAFAKRSTVFSSPRGGVSHRACLNQDSKIFTHGSKSTARAHQRTNLGVRTPRAELLNNAGEKQHAADVKRLQLDMLAGGSADAQP